MNEENKKPQKGFPAQSEPNVNPVPAPEAPAINPEPSQKEAQPEPPVINPEPQTPVPPVAEPSTEIPPTPQQTIPPPPPQASVLQERRRRGGGGVLILSILLLAIFAGVVWYVVQDSLSEFDNDYEIDETSFGDDFNFPEPEPEPEPNQDSEPEIPDGTFPLFSDYITEDDDFTNATSFSNDFPAGTTGSQGFYEWKLGLDFLAQESNFATYYRIGTIGCGTNCFSLKAVDLRDGHVYEAPSTIAGATLFQKDSSLYVVIRQVSDFSPSSELSNELEQVGRNAKAEAYEFNEETKEFTEIQTSYCNYSDTIQELSDCIDMDSVSFDENDLMQGVTQTAHGFVESVTQTSEGWLVAIDLIELQDGDGPVSEVVNNNSELTIFAHDGTSNNIILQTYSNNEEGGFNFNETIQVSEFADLVNGVNTTPQGFNHYDGGSDNQVYFLIQYEMSGSEKQIKGLSEVYTS